MRFHKTGLQGYAKLNVRKTREAAGRIIMSSCLAGLNHPLRYGGDQFRQLLWIDVDIHITSMEMHRNLQTQLNQP